MKTLHHLLICIICLSPLSCKEEAEIPAELPIRRTLLVYLGGDNNLSEENTQKIEALRQAWKQPDGRLLIYSDERNRLPRLIEISPDCKGQSEVYLIKEYAESNSANAETLADVLKTVQSDYPALSYGLIVFSHASGWLPEGTLLNPWKQTLRSVIIDGQSEMDLKKFATVIPDGLFDFIIFETCFMSSVEVVYELRHKTDYIVASSTEMLSPGLTPLYGEIIPMLMQTEANLKGMARKYFDYYNKQPGDHRSATISVIRTAGLEALIATAGITLSETMMDDIKTIQHFDRYTYRLFFDFSDAYSLILEKGAFESLQNCLEQCIIYKAATPFFIAGQGGFEIRYFSGLTTYIEQKEFPFLNEQYKELKWYRELETMKSEN